ncbi:hypothetical protein GCM10010178_24900 [Lentzea flava]|uniref:Uncharacterized protein n=1 Tax=Lentzea flava TaxID=103732 RepID=A0ABQ2UIC2_9PSEU|nr:hypothetical protein GCM10010178_24900 [Lentzea flava]
MQGRVEQGGVQAVAVRLLGDGDLGVDVVTELPGGLKALEHRSVGEALVRETVVEPFQRNRFRARGRPGGGVEAGVGRAGREEAGAVFEPRAVGVEARVHGDGTAAGVVRRAHRDLDLHRVVEDQRCRQREVVEAVQAELVGRAQGEFDESRAGEQGPAADDVVREPRLGCAGQPAGEQDAFAAGEFDGGAEQRVADGGETEAGRVGVLGGRRPEALTLERVRRQVDPAAALVERLPVDRGAFDVQAGQRGDEGAGFGTVLAQGRDASVDQRGQHAVGSDLQEPLVAQGGHRVVEADGVADVADPVLGVRDVAQAGHGRGGEGQIRDGRAEVVEHRVHQRRVEGVADLELLGLAAFEPRDDGTCFFFAARDDDARGSVDRGDRHTGGQVRVDFGFGGFERDHHAVSRQRLHEASARADELGGVFEAEHACDMRGGDLADRVTRDVAGPDAELLQEAVEGDLQGEDRGLRVAGLVQGFGVVAPHDVPDVQVPVDLVERLAERRERLVELAAHAEALRALAGEQHRERFFARDAAGDLGAVEDHGAMVEQRAQRQRVADVLRVAGHARQLGELAVQRLLRLGRDRPRHARNRFRLAGPLGDGSPHSNRLRQV